MVKQFEVYWINLDPTKGSEIKKTRPCAVISPDEMNKNLNTVIVAPLTSATKKYPTRVTTKIDKRTGQIALDQIRTISKERIGKKVEKLNPKAIKQVKSVLLAMFQ